MAASLKLGGDGGGRPRSGSGKQRQAWRAAYESTVCEGGCGGGEGDSGGRATLREPQELLPISEEMKAGHALDLQPFHEGLPAGGQVLCESMQERCVLCMLQQLHYNNLTLHRSCTKIALKRRRKKNKRCCGAQHSVPSPLWRRLYCRYKKATLPCCYACRHKQQMLA